MTKISTGNPPEVDQFDKLKNIIKYVFVAARCFWDQTQNQTFPASKYKVAAQKSYRLWDDTNDAITSEVRETIILLIRRYYMMFGPFSNTKHRRPYIVGGCHLPFLLFSLPH